MMTWVSEEAMCSSFPASKGDWGQRHQSAAQRGGTTPHACFHSQTPAHNTFKKTKLSSPNQNKKTRRTHINDKKFQQHSPSTTNHIPHFGKYHILSNDKRSGNQRDGQSPRRSSPIGRGSPKRKRKLASARRSETQC